MKTNIRDVEKRKINLKLLLTMRKQAEGSRLLTENNQSLEYGRKREAFPRKKAGRYKLGSVSIYLEANELQTLSQKDEN